MDSSNSSCKCSRLSKFDFIFVAVDLTWLLLMVDYYDCCCCCCSYCCTYVYCLVALALFHRCSKTIFYYFVFFFKSLCFLRFAQTDRQKNKKCIHMNATATKGALDFHLIDLISFIADMQCFFFYNHRTISVQTHISSFSAIFYDAVRRSN